MSPIFRPLDPQPGGREAGDAHEVRERETNAARTLLMAEEMALQTLADAERLAANVLAEAEQRARRLVIGAEAPGTARQEQSSAAIENLFRARHQEVLALLTECRDHLRAAREHSSGPDQRRSKGGVGSLTAIDYFAASVPLVTAGEAPHVDDIPPGEEPDIEGRALPGRGEASPQPVLRPWTGATAEHRAGAIRMSARKAAARAAAERLDMQAEALLRAAPGRRARAAGPLSLLLAAGSAFFDDDGVDMPDRRGARTFPGLDPESPPMTR